MTSSGTTAFNPSLGELGLYAYGLLQVRSTSIVQQHMETLRVAANLMLADWSNKGVNLWKVDLVTEPLVVGQTTYAVDQKTIMILDAYLRIDDGIMTPVDRIILPISRSEYASYPQKEQVGFTTVYWFDRLISPTITLWPVPDGVAATELRYYRVTQIEDAKIAGATTMDLPYRWLNAFADGLAWQLARTWAPARVGDLKQDAIASYNTAAGNDVENANMYIAPQLGSYYR